MNCRMACLPCIKHHRVLQGPPQCSGGGPDPEVCVPNRGQGIVPDNIQRLNPGDNSSAYCTHERKQNRSWHYDSGLTAAPVPGGHSSERAADIMGLRPPRSSPRCRQRHMRLGGVCHHDAKRARQRPPALAARSAQSKTLPKFLAG